MGGGGRRRRRGTDKQAVPVELLAHSWPGRAPVGQARAHTRRRGPARTLGFIIHIYIYTYVCTSMSAPRPRVCRLWETAGLDVARSRRSACAACCTLQQGPRTHLRFYCIYISTSVSLVVCALHSHK